MEEYRGGETADREINHAVPNKERGKIYGVAVVG
jgi:hypothetical protein